MTKLNELFEVKTRNDGEKFYCIKDEPKKSDLGKSCTDLIHELHGTVLPTDAVYELVSDALSQVYDYESCEDYEQGICDSLMPIYYSEISEMYSNLRRVIEEHWDTLSDYVNISPKELDPSTFEQQALGAYIMFASGMIARWCEDCGAWSDEETQEEETDTQSRD